MHVVYIIIMSPRAVRYVPAIWRTCVLYCRVRVSTVRRITMTVRARGMRLKPSTFTCPVPRMYEVDSLLLLSTQKEKDRVTARSTAADPRITFV